jgi:hypothetical protein
MIMNFEAMEKDLEARGLGDTGFVCIPLIAGKFVLIQYDVNGLAKVVERPVHAIAFYERLGDFSIRPICDLGRPEVKKPISEDEKQIRIDELENALERSKKGHSFATRLAAIGVLGVIVVWAVAVIAQAGTVL